MTDKLESELEKRRDSLDFDTSQQICCTSLTKGISHVKPIGWMAIFGDGLSNFIDGLSIGLFGFFVIVSSLFFLIL